MRNKLNRPIHHNTEKHHNKTEANKLSQEHISGSAENNHESYKNRSADHEKEVKNKLEVARRNIEKESITREDHARTPNNEQASKHPHYFTKVDRERSFKLTMRHVRSNLNKPQKVFSNIIHQPAIEKVSQVAEVTIARPSGIIGATSTALLGIGIMLIIAKRTGFPLAGSEFWMLLCAGYLTGLIVEAIKKLLRRNRKVNV